MPPELPNSPVLVSSGDNADEEGKEDSAAPLPDVHRCRTEDSRCVPRHPKDAAKAAPRKIGGALARLGRGRTFPLMSKYLTLFLFVAIDVVPTIIPSW